VYSRAWRPWGEVGFETRRTAAGQQTQGLLRLGAKGSVAGRDQLSIHFDLRPGTAGDGASGDTDENSRTSCAFVSFSAADRSAPHATAHATQSALRARLPGMSAGSGRGTRWITLPSPGAATAGCDEILHRSCSIAFGVRPWRSSCWRISADTFAALLASVISS